MSKALDDALSGYKVARASTAGLREKYRVKQAQLVDLEVKWQTARMQDITANQAQLAQIKSDLDVALKTEDAARGLILSIAETP